MENRKALAPARHLLRSIGVPLLLAALLPVSPPATAALIPLDLKQLTERSRYVLCGEVVGMESYWKDFPRLGRAIVTDVHVRIAEMWKGEAPGETITIQLFGGRVGEEWQLCLESPRYEVGEKVLVFARNWKGGLWTTGWEQGKYRLLETPRGVHVLGRRHRPIATVHPAVVLRDHVRKLVLSSAAKKPLLAPKDLPGTRTLSPVNTGEESKRP